MQSHLKVDPNQRMGYKQHDGAPGPNEAAIALTSRSGRCVFGNPADALTNETITRRFDLMRYDDEIERQRRLVCDTALAQIMLDNPHFANPAVTNVSNGIKAYWAARRLQLNVDQGQEIVNRDGRHVSSPTSFGRLQPAASSQNNVDHFRNTIDSWIVAMAGNDLPQIMNVHDTFLKIYCTEHRTTNKDKATSYNLRETWYETEARGRESRIKKEVINGETITTNLYTPSELPGLISEYFTIDYKSSLKRSGIDFTTMRREKRDRGVDMFRMDATKMLAEFKNQLGTNNLVFAASASGTTATLLASAFTFMDGLSTAHDSVKEYLMGCIAYLVGGGMHICHEVFVTGGRVQGLNYVPGKYIGMLPSRFLNHSLYVQWSNEFWDIVRPDRAKPR
ncbi:MAG: hypothetical protein WCH43_11165 [Verrucomicrobiota bacterium]